MPEYTAVNVIPALLSTDSTPLLTGGPSTGQGAGAAPPPPPPQYADDVGCWVGWKREPHMKCFLLTASMFTVLALFLTDSSAWLAETSGSKENPNNFYGIFFTLLGLYLLECCCADTRKYLGLIGDISDVTLYYLRTVAAAPWIRWHIQCYHYETRVRHRSAVTRKPPPPPRPPPSSILLIKYMLYHTTMHV